MPLRLLVAIYTLIALSSGASPDSRGCPANETRTSYDSTSFNATGAYRFDGFSSSADPHNFTQWTLSAGVRQLYNASLSRLDDTISHAIWLDTDGVDLTAADLPYRVCHLTLLDQSQTVQQIGQGDSGNCGTFLSQQCVDDWKKVSTNEALRFREGNFSTSRNDTPCAKIRDREPASCKGFRGSASLLGSIPSNRNRTCAFGLGDPDLDLVTEYVEQSVSGTTDFQLYDKEVTRITPVIVTAWTIPEGGSGWAASRVVCLGTPNITDGSRKPDGVPSGGERLLSGDGRVLATVLGVSIALMALAAL